MNSIGKNNSNPASTALLFFFHWTAYYCVILFLSFQFTFELSAQNPLKPAVIASAAPIPSAMGTPLRGSGMMFAENKGQYVDMDRKSRPDILFKGSGAGADVYLRKTGISYVLNNMGYVKSTIEEQLEEMGKLAGTIPPGDESKQKLREELLNKAIYKIHRIDLDFEGCSNNIEVVSSDKVEGYCNYYLSHCPDGITGVLAYNKIVYQNVYPKIDVIFYGDKQTGVKYDIVVRPGGNPNDIKLRYSGIDNITVNNGQLIIENSVRTLTEQMPKIYQVINGQVIDVKANYYLNRPDSYRDRESESDAIVNFSILNYNSSFPLIIDPWVTYYGGASNDMSFGIKVDSADNVIVVGGTGSVNFPVSAGAFQGSKNAVSTFDITLVKLSPKGNILWATYYGGDGNDGVTISQRTSPRIATDGTNIYIVGTYDAGLPNFPLTTNVYKGTAEDAFIAKFGPAGNRIWATSYGGTGTDNGFGIDADLNGDIIICGNTNSIDFPVTAGAYQLTRKGLWDSFIVKFDGGGNRLWSTYVGGSSDEMYYTCIAADKQNNIVTAGHTASMDFPVSAGVYQNSATGFVGGNNFVFKIGPTGNYIWSTFYGSTAAGWDLSIRNIITDGNDDIIFTGTTNKPSIATSGVCQENLKAWKFAGWTNTYVTKLSSLGARLWATYYTKTGYSYPGGLSADIGNNIYLLTEEEDGSAGNYPSPCAYQPTFGGNEDQTIVKFNPNGLCSCETYLGGSAEDELESYYGGIFCKGRYMYITATSGGNYPVTAGAFQTLYGGPAGAGMSPGDMTIAKLCSKGCGDASKPIVAFTANTTICAGSTVNFTNQSTVTSCDAAETTWEWTFTGGTPSSSYLQNPPGIVYNTPGAYGVKLVVTACERDSLIQNAYITVNSCGCTLTGQFTRGTAGCTGCGCKEWIMVTASGGTSPYSYTWPDGYSKRYKNNLCPGAYTINIKDKNGCSMNINLTAP